MLIRIVPVTGPASLLQYMKCIQQKNSANGTCRRIIEEEIESAIESRNESLSALRELGPPDLVHLVKQSVKSGGRQVYHMALVEMGRVADLFG